MATPSSINLNDAIPAAPAGRKNAKWQAGPYFADATYGRVRYVSANVPNLGGVNPQAGTSYELVAGDLGKLVKFNTSSAVALSLDSTLEAAFVCAVSNLGTGTVTVTPTTGQVNGGSSLALGGNAWLFFDGVNWWAFVGGAGGPGGGSTWYDGTGAPSSGLGADGDYYLNDANGDVYHKAAGAWTVATNILGPAGPAAARGTVTFTTGSLANGANETGSAALGKSLLIHKVEVSCKARVQLYATAAKRDADTGRAPDALGKVPPPVVGSDHGVILDLYLNDAAKLTWLVSPKVADGNGDSPGATAIYYRVTNLDTTQAITVTVTRVLLEA